MGKHKAIAHSDTSTVGDGTCDSCHKIINGLYMITHIYDMKSRGNENDTVKVRCEACCDPKDKTWVKYRLKVSKEREDAERLQKQRENDPYRFAKIVAGECTVETEYDCRTYETCFYCDANIGDGAKHEEDCVHLEAKKFLASKGITDYE